MNDSVNNTAPTLLCGPKFPEEEDCVKVNFYLNTVIGGLLCLVGLIGNTLSFVVLSKDKQTPIASMLLQALAFTDNFFLIFWLLHIAVKYLLSYVGVEAWSSEVWARINIHLYPFLFIGQTSTIWMTVFIAFTRYFAVCRPYSAARVWNTKTIRTGIIIIFTFSVLYNIPRFFEYTIDKIVHCDTYYYPPKRIIISSQIYRFYYFDVMYYVFMFGLPFALLTILNIKLIVAYREVQRRRQRMISSRGSISHVTENGHESGSHDGHREPNITLVMIVVIVIFMLCNLPARLVQLVMKYDPDPYSCLSFPYFMMQFTNVLEALNSSSNFAVYCVFRYQFRTILRQGPCCNNPTGSQLRPNHTDAQASQSLLNGTAKVHHMTCQNTKL